MTLFFDIGLLLRDELSAARDLLSRDTGEDHRKGSDSVWIDADL